MSDDGSADGVDHLADVVLANLSVGLGVRIIDEWGSKDDYLFHGPHGRLEHVSYSENLDQWKRGLYQIDEVLRDRLVNAIDGHPQFAGWSYVRREQLGEPEPVVIDISEPARCTLCDERFPSGNAFGWHLADVHQIDTEDKMEFAVPEPENQHTLNKWAGGSA
ncbi:C2H2-type zinc finger protein [Halorubrum halodurans]|uniref:C2H2-type domain-containing protein n=1 Tax=Halorubrum halodurans TaxID=1383851 RepID=A0A256IMD8_9EURY|nr:C2H2-type zinc finger protein [Halorubrum halodurans]OYR57728.1 hypothetical protein DJ70_05045 [Halorubrum halodurans]